MCLTASSKPEEKIQVKMLGEKRKVSNHLFKSFYLVTLAISQKIVYNVHEITKQKKDLLSGIIMVEVNMIVISKERMKTGNL